ncbi:MAG: Gfo/Idh/MocA family oxidoreductase [Gammaproteobacteria bacterium]|nr:Gfo/Idh/MocA family oxidoreductase [Gammaproteobacteria bacterium]
MKNKLDVGIVGLGKMGHIRAGVIKKHPELNLFAVCDVIETKGKDFPESKFFHNYNDLLKQSLDAVFVCTPNRYIPEIVVAALERGMNVFCEKPPGRNLDDVVMMQEAEKANPSTKLKFGFNHRYHEAVQEAKSIVHSGRLGRIMWIRGIYGKAGGSSYDKDWRSKPEISGGGILIDQGIHILDLVRIFCEDFTDIHSFITHSYWNTGVEDNAFIIMKNAASQVAMVHSSATQWQHRFLMEIYLEKGYLTIDGILSSTGTYEPETLKVARCLYDNDGYPLPNPHETLTLYEEDKSWYLEVDDFIRSILEDKPVDVGSSQDAYKVMELVQRIYRADKEWVRHLDRRGGPSK